MAAFFGLPRDAAHAYARLHGRTRQPVRRDAFKPPGIQAIEAQLAKLRAAGLIDLGHHVPPSSRVGLMRVPELKAAL